MNTTRFQFGIRRLLILTTAVAVVMAISVQFDGTPFAQGVLGAYFALLAGWAVMRGPYVYANLVSMRNRRREVKQRRLELEREALDLKRTE